MGPTKIMIIRHAEKPGMYGTSNYLGINALGEQDPDSLVTMGWERAGGIASLFDPTDKIFQNKELARPDYIYAADPGLKTKVKASGKIVEDEPSQRPYQTISALAAKMKLSGNHLNISFEKNKYAGMVASVLTHTGTVLISWQHQDILPKQKGDDCIVSELLRQTNTTAHLGIPAGAWPGSRYDMVFVFDRPGGTGPFTKFTQVPQLLLAGDLNTKF